MDSNPSHIVKVYDIAIPGGVGYVKEIMGHYIQRITPDITQAFCMTEFQAEEVLDRMSWDGGLWAEILEPCHGTC